MANFHNKLSWNVGEESCGRKGRVLGLLGYYVGYDNDINAVTLSILLHTHKNISSWLCDNFIVLHCIGNKCPTDQLIYRMWTIFQ